MILNLTSLAILIAAGSTAALACPIVGRRYAARGRIDRPGGRKTQAAPVPYGAGLAAFIGVLVPIAMGYLWFLFARLEWFEVPHLFAIHSRGVFAKVPEVAVIAGGTLTMLLMGRADDRQPMSAASRLVVQCAAALLVALIGPRATVFLDAAWMQIAATVVWIVFLTNACNFIDNMDGLLAGCAAASAAAIGLVAGFGGHLFVAGLATAVMGAMLGVLIHNRAPARIYLGDEGSMSIGFLLACLTLAATWFEADGGPAARITVILLPCLCLIVPIADGATVIVSRTLRGVSPLSAGLDHLSHRLERAGFGRRGAVALLHAVAAFGGAAAVAIATTGVAARMAALFLTLVGIGRLVTSKRESEWNATGTRPGRP